MKLTDSGVSIDNELGGVSRRSQNDAAAVRIFIRQNSIHNQKQSKTKQKGGVLRQRNNNRRLSNKTYALSAQPKGDETRRGSQMADAKLSRPAKTKITKTLCSG